MNELDLMDAINDIDDRYIVEAAEGVAGGSVMHTKGTVKRRRAVWSSVPALAAAGIALAILVAGGITAVKLLQRRTKGKESVKTEYAAGKPFMKGEVLTTPLTAEQLEEFRQMPGILEIDGRYYGSQETECSQVGAKIGTYTVRGNTEEIVVENGEEHLEIVEHELDADVYGIPGVKTSYAVAVYYEDIQKYVVFGGVIPDVDTVAELREEIPFDTYFEMDKTYKVMINGLPATYTDSTVTLEKVVNILFKNADSPIYDLKDMPNAFFKDTPFFDEWAGREHHVWDSWISRYDTVENPEEGKDWAQKFCKEHPLGELLGIGYVHNKLIEPVNASGVQYYLYSGGYILGMGGGFGKCIYVGPEAAQEFIALFQFPMKSTEPTE
ncbi:MAG: hypothetical protein J5643_03730 [Lachnospiraceae bacterium]|nr:hypothetical protein [Lachnospiraceae bacterium]